MTHPIIDLLLTHGGLTPATDLTPRTSALKKLLAFKTPGFLPIPEIDLLKLAISPIAEKAKEIGTCTTETSEARYFQFHIADQLTSLCLELEDYLGKENFEIPERCQEKLQAIYRVYQFYASAGIAANSDRFDQAFALLFHLFSGNLQGEDILQHISESKKYRSDGYERNKESLAVLRKAQSDGKEQVSPQALQIAVKQIGVPSRHASSTASLAAQSYQLTAKTLTATPSRKSVKFALQN